MHSKAGIATGVALALLVSARGQAAPIQWEGNGHWYEFVSAPYIYWADARDAAAGRVFEIAPGDLRHGYLATVTSQAENDWLVANIYPPSPWQYGKLWLGGYQDKTAPDYWEPGGGWRWVTHDGIQEPWSYTNWYIGEPNGQPGEDFLEVFLHVIPKGKWNDISNEGGQPSWTAGFVVEFIPEPSSFVLLVAAGLAIRAIRRRDRQVFCDC